MKNLKKRKKLKKLIAIITLLTIAFSPLQFMQAATKAPSLSHTGTNYISIGKKLNINVKNKISKSKYTWTSSNKKVATVNEKGVVKGLKKGTSTIKCKIKTSSKSYTLKTKIEVYQAANSVKINNKIKTLLLGDMYTLKVGMSPNKANDKITWKSSNTSVAKISKKGVVTALSSGTTKITATTLGGKKDNVTIKVTDIATASTQDELTKALSNKKIKELVVNTNDSIAFTIPADTYTNLSLTVNTPNADITNNAKFNNIIINAIKANTWTENAVGNSLTINASNARLIITENAQVKDIVSQGEELDLVIDGKITDSLTLKSNGKVNITGNTNTELVVIVDTAGAKLETGVKIKVELNANAELTFNEGAEGSIINKLTSGIIDTIINNTKEIIDVLIEGKTENPTQPTIPNNNIENNNSGNNNSENNNSENNNSENNNSENNENNNENTGDNGNNNENNNENETPATPSVSNVVASNESIAAGTSVTGTITGTNMDNTVSVKLYNSNNTTAIDTTKYTVTYGGSATSKTFTLTIAETLETGDYTLVVFVGDSKKNVSINLTVTKIPEDSFTVTYTMTNLTTTGSTAVTSGSSLNVTLAAEEGYTLPHVVVVNMNNITLTAGTDYTYDNVTGVISIVKVLGNIIITAIGMEVEDEIEEEYNKYVKVEVGRYSTLAIKDDGTVWGWGSIPKMSIIDYVPTKIEGLEGAVDIDIYSINSCVAIVKNDGTVWNWGSNSYGELGNGTNVDSNTPTQLQGLSDVKTVEAGNGHVLALKNDGTVWAWGRNSYGQLGNGTNSDSNVPVQVSGLSDIIDISTYYYHSMALKKDGTVWIWGYNSSGQLGDGTKENSAIPKKVEDLTNIIDIAAGSDSSIALKSDETVWAWGSMTGNETTSNSLTPIQVSNLSGIVAISSGGCNAALKEDGTVWTWGSSNYAGQLGNIDYTKSGIPKKVKDLNNVMAISTGGGHTAVIKDDGSIWSWGSNEYWQLGDGMNTSSITPKQVADNLTGAKSIATGGEHMSVLKDDGTVWSWGINAYGQFGDGSYNSSNIPVQTNIDGKIIDIGANSNRGIALMEDKTVWTWGSNNSSPSKISQLSEITAVSVGYNHYMALKEDKTVWTWGSNTYGQLGDGTSISISNPVQVLTDVIAISAGSDYSLAVKNDGTVWAWGSNLHGRLGDGTNENRNIPVQVSNLTDVIAVSAGSSHSLALKSNGEVWAWGEGSRGQLGNASSNSSNIPIQVQGLNNIQSISINGADSLSYSNDSFSMALDTNGVVWTWGEGSNGQLGNGERTDAYVPVQVSGLTDVISISAGARTASAIKSDGTIWTWGYGCTYLPVRALE